MLIYHCPSFISSFSVLCDYIEHAAEEREKDHSTNIHLINNTHGILFFITDYTSFI